MPMPLDQWQERLERHFTELVAVRANSGFPLFALEHDLKHDEIEEIDRQLCSRIRASLPLRPHWLVWVVFATERGYDYDGGEYWHSIEQRTVHWDHAQRHQLRGWFKKFQQTYHGVIPSGPWAEWFSIIAWPITHAILPKYLQWQFAKALYDLRYRLARLDVLTPLDVGRLLAENTWDASSRFREFLQQEELVGRLVLALLSDRKVEEQSPIYERTLERLVSDLEQVRSTREWLKETRRYVADRLKGAGRGAEGQPVTREPPLLRPPPGTAELPDIRPTLMLRRSGPSSWSVVVEIPSFAAVARLHPELRTFIKSTRCKIAGAGDIWLPMGWLAASSQKRVLKSWPGAAAPLVRFERTNSILDHLVDSETRLSQGSIWVCRIGADGLAHEITGRVVRPNQRYVLLSETALPRARPMLGDCAVDCHGVNAVLLSVPNGLAIDDLNFLHQLGLQVARMMQIWPAGVVGRSWDGEGHSEWLTTESPCFGIVHDHPLDAYSLRLNDGPETLVAAGGVRHPVFIRLPPLPAGWHTLSVKARRLGQAYPMPSSPPAEGVVALEVREPEPWSPGTTSYTGLAVAVEPQEPTLDTFWESDVDLRVLGPDGHQVACTITLTNANGKEILSEKIGTFDLPITSAAWRRKFKQFANDDNRAWAYLEAASGRFVIAGDELGQYALRLERDVRPIQWICRNAHRATTVRLIDDTGRDEPAICSFYGFHSAAEPIPLSTVAVLAGQNITPPGGLFVARHGEVTDAIIVSVAAVERDLRGLLIEPDLKALHSDLDHVEKVIGVLSLWSRTRVAGPLAGARRARIVTRLTNYVYGKLCGVRWAQAEAAFLEDPDSVPAMQTLERAVGGIQGFPIVLRRDYDRMASGTAAGSQWYAEVARRYRVCSDPKLCTLSLRIASQPEHLLSLPDLERQQFLRSLNYNVALLRGARLVAVLAATRDREAGVSSMPRWTW